MSYKEKYLKYKKKYIEAKKLVGGADFISCPELETNGFRNQVGSCTMASIISILFYNGVIGEIMQKTLLTGNIKDLISDAIPQLRVFLPEYICSHRNFSNSLENFLESIKTRISIKVDTALIEQSIKYPVLERASSRSEPEPPVLERASSWVISPFNEQYKKLDLLRQNSSLCERDNMSLAKKILYPDIVLPIDGLTILDQMYIANILSRILIKKFINYSNHSWYKQDYYIDILSDKDLIGVVLEIDDHAAGFFKCNELKYINNNYISTFDYIEFYRIINDINSTYLGKGRYSGLPRIIIPFQAEPYIDHYFGPDTTKQILLKDYILLQSDNFVDDFNYKNTIKLIKNYNFFINEYNMTRDAEEHVPLIEEPAPQPPELIKLNSMYRSDDYNM